MSPSLSLGSTLEITAGPHDRAWVPLVVSGAGDSPAPALEPLDAAGPEIPAQRLGDDSLTFLLPALAAGQTARYRVVEPTQPSSVAALAAGENRYDFLLGGQLFTSYLVGPEWARPHCLPVYGPGGVEVTRTTAGDHPHHRSIWVAQGAVNGHDNWTENPHHARTVNQSCAVTAEGPVCAQLLAENDWETHEGKKLFAETTRLTVYNLPGEARMMDWDITWTAAYGGVFFEDTKEAGTLSVRVAESMRGDHGGRMVNGYGGVGEDECWGKPAPWVDYSGLSEGRHVGLALLDHPTNFHYPTPWHVRDYGLFAANGWGRHDYADDWSVRGDYALPAGQSLHWTFRIYIHEGDEQTGEVAARWLDFAFPPQVTVLD